MTESENLLKNRLSELSRRALSRGLYTCSEFLTIAEQDLLCGMSFDTGSAPFTLFGGYDAAERRLACFGTEELFGYPPKPPIACVRISPVSRKFADKLTHRDFLGSLMAVGVRRSVLGDIIVRENEAHLFCLESVSGFITDQFQKVKHTDVRCFVTDAPEFTAEEPEPAEINIASERLDALISAVYKLPRSESQELILKGKVFINGRLTQNSSFSPAPGCVISLRGLGRFSYEGIERETRKGRLKVLVRLY
ncbi:MAG: YlmH/Sll1252 family protein [Bacillota bacterium]|nr:YlmH/Sll1252 family protein [Bacillota bacterium]